MEQRYERKAFQMIFIMQLFRFLWNKCCQHINGINKEKKKGKPFGILLSFLWMDETQSSHCERYFYSSRVVESDAYINGYHHSLTPFLFFLYIPCLLSTFTNSDSQFQTFPSFFLNIFIYFYCCLIFLIKCLSLSPITLSYVT